MGGRDVRTEARKELVVGDWDLSDIPLARAAERLASLSSPSDSAIRNCSDKPHMRWPAIPCPVSRFFGTVNQG